MKDRITIEGRDGAFAAYIARPMTLSARAVVVLQELFGVNADIRKTCDELAEQGSGGRSRELTLTLPPRLTGNTAFVCTELMTETREQRTSRTRSTQYATSRSATARLPSSVIASAR